MSSTAERTVDLLRLLAHEDEGLTTSELAERLQTSLATASRAVQSLIELGALQRDERTGRVKIAIGLWGVGAAALRQVQFRRLVISCVSQAVSDLGRVVHFGLPDRNNAISVERLDLVGNLVMSTPLGWPVPYHAGTVGKPILAHMPQAERERILARGLERYTTSTITDCLLLEQELQQIRERGFATNRAEFRPNGMAVGVVLLDAAGCPVASLSTPASEQEFKADVPVVRNLVSLGRTISSLLGHTEHPDSSFF